MKAVVQIGIKDITGRWSWSVLGRRRHHADAVALAIREAKAYQIEFGSHRAIAVGWGDYRPTFSGTVVSKHGTKSDFENSYEGHP